MKKTLMLSLALTLLVLGVPHLIAGEGQTDEKPMDHSEMMAEGDSGDMSAMHDQMMARHQKRLDEMKAKQEELASLVEAMNSADDHGESIDAIAAVLNELVAQHQARMGQHIEMMEKMGDMPMGHSGMARHHGMKGHHGKKGCSHCKPGAACPHKKAGEACPHCDGDGECPHCKAGGQRMHHKHHDGCSMGEDCPHHEKMKDDTMKEGGMDASSEGR